MMKVEQIKTPDDIERYIEGCLNDFETAISTKGETVVFLAELVVHIYKEAKKEQLTIPAVVGRSEQLKALEQLKDFAYDNCQPHNSDRLAEIMERL